MNKYRFARLYLSALLALGIILFAVGVTGFIILTCVAASDHYEARRIIQAPVTIDTLSPNKHIEALPTTIKQSFALTLPTPPGSGMFPLGKNVSLTFKQFQGFKRYLSSSERYVESLKLSLLKQYDDPIVTLINAAGKSLPTPPPPAQQGGRLVVKAQCYDDLPAFARNTETLATISYFLTNIVSHYTPSGYAMKIAKDADSVLMSAIVLMKNGNCMDKTRPDNDDAIKDFTTIIENGLKHERDKSALTLEFIDLLERTRPVVSSILCQNWMADSAINKTKQDIERIEQTRSESAERLNASCWTNIGMAAGSLLTFSLMAFLFFIFRDFMSAVIDTAANTAGILKRLSGSNIEVE